MRVLANDGISETGKKALEEAEIELLESRVFPEHLPKFINENQVNVLVVAQTRVDDDLIDQCPGLKIIGKLGVETDNINVDYALEKGIEILTTPKSVARSVAEMVFAHLFSLVRNLHESNRMMPLEGDTQFIELKKTYQNSLELEGKTLGIIGSNENAQEVAKLAISLGMKVKIYSEEKKSFSLALSFFDGQKVEFSLNSTQNLEEVLKESDFITLHETESENYFIDFSQFEIMKEGVFIINVENSQMMNEVALLEAIDDGIIAGAALDVFENQPNPELTLLMNPALSLSPNIATSTNEFQEKAGIEIAEKLKELKKKLYK